METLIHRYNHHPAAAQLKFILLSVILQVGWTHWMASVNKAFYDIIEVPCEVTQWEMACCDTLA